MNTHDKLVAQSVFWELFSEHLTTRQRLKDNRQSSTGEIEELWARVRIDAERIESFWPGLISSFKVSPKDWEGLWQYIITVMQTFQREAESVSRVFIGHGHSAAWLSLKAFIAEELHLNWDEFNREAPTGYTTIDRLSDMLDQAKMAFLVLTAEDEFRGAVRRPRSNVIHEAGLFQGRLGFDRAIILLEDSCDAFSNVDGLAYIAFPAGNINACFDEVARVLIREDFDLPAPKTLNVAFTATLRATSRDWLLAVVWLDSSSFLRTRRRVKVKGRIDGHVFEDWCEPVGDGTHRLKMLRSTIGKKVGDTVNITVEERLS